MVLIYVGEVGNGGHTQFFSNRGGDIAARARNALREFGLVQLETLLARAGALFPGQRVPAERAEVDRFLRTWGSDRHAQLDRLDRQVSKVNVYPRLVAYLLEHEDEVLRAERGLGETPR
ncbi:MAG: DMP19 family protein [Polyangiaceae bacterium]